MALARLIPAPQPSYRLIPSRFPPIGLFDSVSQPGDLEAVMELAGWTNDRLVAERLARLASEDWVYGRANSSIVMAAFLHAPPAGARFSGPELGAWYAAVRIETATAEVAHHLRRECWARGIANETRQYRTYSARLEGDYHDLRDSSDAASFPSDDYAASQRFGEALRANGADGIVYESFRHRGGVAVCAYRPRKVLDVVQTDHFALTVHTGSPTIEVERLAAE